MALVLAILLALVPQTFDPQLLGHAEGHGYRARISLAGGAELAESGEALLGVVGTSRPQRVDGRVTTICTDETGTFGFAGRFTIRGGQSFILPTGPTDVWQTFPRTCYAFVILKLRKGGSISLDLWTYHV